MAKKKNIVESVETIAPVVEETNEVVVEEATEQVVEEPKVETKETTNVDAVKETVVNTEEVKTKPEAPQTKNNGMITYYWNGQFFG